MKANNRISSSHARAASKRGPVEPQFGPRDVMQTKKTGPSQIKQPGVAPPVYRPLPTPTVLQTKSAVHHELISPSAGVSRWPAAPPAYRPQPVPKVLQTKRASGQARQSAAPPVYRPEPKKIAQPKMLANHRPAGQSHHATLPRVAPAVYRPQQVTHIETRRTETRSIQRMTPASTDLRSHALPARANIIQRSEAQAEPSHTDRVGRGLFLALSLAVAVSTALDEWKLEEKDRSWDATGVLMAITAALGFVITLKQCLQTLLKQQEWYSTNDDRYSGAAWWREMIKLSLLVPVVVGAGVALGFTYPWAAGAIVLGGFAAGDFLEELNKLLGALKGFLDRRAAALNHGLQATEDTRLYDAQL